MAKVIVSGYLKKTVPLSATTSQVYQSVVIPWLKSGAGGLFSYAPFAAENTANGNIQGLLVQGVVDRYLAGLPITRADMVEYDGQGYTDHEPALNVALAPLLQTTTAPSKSPSVALAKAPTAKVTAPLAAAGTAVATQVAASGAIPTQPVAAANISSVAGNGGTTPATVAPLTDTQDTTAALLTQILANQENANMTSPAAQQVVADVAANGVQQTDLGPPSAFDLSEVPWYVWVGGAGLIAYLAMRK
jgi:hypothetical protein